MSAGDSDKSSRSSGLVWLVSLAALALATVAMLQNAFREPANPGTEGTEGSGPARPSNTVASAASSGLSPQVLADPQERGKGVSAAKKPQPASETDSPQPTLWLPAESVPATKDELEAEAEFVAQQLMQALPNQSAAVHVMALLTAQLHRTEEAEQLWKQCIEIDPVVDQYYVNLAAIAMDRGDNQLAIDTLQQALERDLQSLDLYHHLGVALTNVGRTEEALAVIQQALELQPNSAPMWLILGQAQLKAGETEQAEQSLRKAIGLGATTKPAYFALFNACMRNGKREEAKRFREIYAGFDKEESLEADERYQVLSESEAKRVATSIMLEAAILYVAAQMPRDAEHLLLRVLALEPEHKAALLELVKVVESQNRPADERVLRLRLTEVDRLNLLNFLLLAKAEIACGRPLAAEAAIKHAISLSPQTVTGYAAMTDFLLEQRRPEEAQWYIAHALQLKPSQTGYQLLAKTLRAQGKEVEAQQADAAGANLNP